MFRGLFSGRREGSGGVAKSRLQTLLFQDRMNLPANFLDMMAFDIASVLSGYVDVEPGRVDIKVGKRRDGGKTETVLEIVMPVQSIHLDRAEQKGEEPQEEIIIA